MRILYCNKYDYPFSGTEAYLFDLIHQMDERGHETALFSMDHGRTPAFTGRSYRIPYLDFKDPNASLLKKVKMAAHALYSPSARRAMRSCLADFSPDLAHVRGIYHHLSPSILWELKRQGIPVLYHLNDFKILCPTYNFVADGRACEALQARRFPPRRHERLLCRPAFQRGGSCRRSLPAQMVANLRTLRGPVPGSQRIRARQVDRQRFPCATHRSPAPLPGSARRRRHRHRRRIPALLRPALPGERRRTNSCAPWCGCRTFLWSSRETVPSVPGSSRWRKN